VTAEDARVPVAVIGSGNIGTDLVEKLRRSSVLDLRYVVGIDPESAGLKRAASYGIETSAAGVDWLLDRPELPRIVFEATSAAIHIGHAPRYAAAKIRAVDLTPAAIGPYVVPPVNLADHLDEMNVNMVTCGGQATVPMVRAVSRVVDVEYSEIVATVASKSAGPGTRANIDEFTTTTANAVEKIGQVSRGKAIIILNPADPPLIMRDTVLCSLPAGTDEAAVCDSILKMEAAVQTYVSGYRLRQPPQFDDGRVTILLEIEGAGDFLPRYAGNLDIMTAAAAKVGDEIGKRLLRDGA
jgi:acetaldehyde dehydrogenase